MPKCPKSVVLGMNRVPVVPLELILSQDGATGTRKLSKPLPPLFPPTWDSKRSKNIEIEELTSFLGNCVSRRASPSRPWSSLRIARRGTPRDGSLHLAYPRPLAKTELGALPVAFQILPRQGLPAHCPPRGFAQNLGYAGSPCGGHVK